MSSRVSKIPNHLHNTSANLGDWFARQIDELTFLALMQRPKGVLYMPEDAKENWVLFNTQYNFMALPVSVAVEVMKHMVCLESIGGKMELSDKEIKVQMLNKDAMTVAIAKHKMVSKAE